MVPDIAKTGHSFKGAMAYYLHDKRQEGQEAHPQTAERVAWTETRNLPTDDPDLARRVMAHTAMRADDLKAAAGIKNTGRKSSAHVYAYSLAWHPDEAGKLDQLEMLRAVDSSLKALGAEGHQAVIVCHRDQKHPHVHVILNRVDPKTGVLLSTSNDRLKLSDWANEYERMRGVILTPKREEKRQLRDQFAEKAQRREYAQQQRQKAEQRPEDSKSRAAMLKEFGDRQKADHRQQWKDLAQDNTKKRGAIYDRWGAAIKAAAERHKVECKPIWAAYFKHDRANVRTFNENERSLAGVIRNAMDATTHQKVSGQLGNRGTLSATFGNVLSSQRRAQAFAERQDMNRQQMAACLKSILDDEIRQMKEQRGAQLLAQRQAFDAARDVLAKTQNEDRAKIRQAWQHVYAERGRSFGDRHQKGPIHAAKARQDAASVQEQKPMKRDFENAQRFEQSRPKMETTPEFVSRPAPAPSPAGDVPAPAKRDLRDVPAHKEATPAKVTPAAAKDWKGATAEKATAPPPKDWSAPAQASTQQVSAKDWNAKAATVDQNRGMPDRSRDRGPERD